MLKTSKTDLAHESDVKGKCHKYDSNKTVVQSYTFQIINKTCSKKHFSNSSHQTEYLFYVLKVHKKP